MGIVDYWSGNEDDGETTKLVLDPGGNWSVLASKNVLAEVLQLGQSLSYPGSRHTLLLSLKLLRNLCAGELSNQNSFLKRKGVGIVSTILSSIRLVSDTDYGIIRIGLQTLANVSLAGEEHQHIVWHQLFLLSILSEILNEQLEDIEVLKNSSFGVLGLLNSALGVVNSVTRVKSGLSTGSADFDVPGYSLPFQRYSCQCLGSSGQDGFVDVVDYLLLQS